MQNRYPTKVTHINSFEQDSARRDFTVNSLGINSKGELIDYQGGLEDLKNGIIRAVGEPRKRFTEDALRILRLFRFAAKYEFDIDSKTKEAAKELAHLVDKLSIERISDELKKISGIGSHLANYIEHLDEVGLLERILPEVKALQGKKQNPIHHPEGDAYEHTLSALKYSMSKNPTTNLAILFHDIGKASTAGTKNDQPTYHGHDKDSARLAVEIGKRLKFPSKTIEAIEFAAANHMKAHNINDMSKKKIATIVNSPYWPILKDVAYADTLSRGDIDKGGIDEFNSKMETAENITQKLSGQGGAEGLRLLIKEKIDGKKVMDWTGLQPGNEMGTILKLAQDWLYNNMEASNKEVKDFVLSTYRDLKSKMPTSLEDQYDIIRRRSHEQETV